MDGTSFDRWLTALTSTPQRNGTPAPRGRRALLGGALAAVLTPLVIQDDTSAKNKGGKGGKGKGKGKGKCKSGTKKCGTKCIPAGKCCTDADCSLCREEVCTNGICGCKPPAFDHNGVCGEPPLCLVVGELCDADSECCSGHCNVMADNGDLRCNRGILKCVTDFDCDPGFACRGFACTFNPPCS